MTNSSCRELGIPIRSVNWARVFAGQRANGEPVLLTCMGQQAGDLFVCDVDTGTGHCRQHAVRLEYASYPTAAHYSAGTGKLYIGSAYTGHLHCYDVNLPPAERHLEDLGPIHPGLCAFPCAIDEAPDGDLYIGAYPGCCLTRYNPKTREFTRYGSVDEVDKYFYPACGADGTVAGLVKMTDPHVIVFDPETGVAIRVGPSSDLEAILTGGGDKSVLSLRKGDDGLLYILSEAGNYRVQGPTATRVDDVPPAMPLSTLPDGSVADLHEARETGHRKIRLTRPNGEERSLALDWEGGGTALFIVHQGPDDKLYGSSILPEHLFVCDLDGSNMGDLGICSESIGEAYSMANFGGKLYIGSYPDARLSVYDPWLPYRYGVEPDSNPRDIGRLDNVSLRPRAMLAGPAGKVWIGSYPAYGIWGGTLAWYDPASGDSKSHRHLVQDASISALEWIPELDRILVGTSITGGSGTDPRASASPLVIWNPYSDEAEATLDFGLGLNDEVIDIEYCGAGMAYIVAFFRSPSAEAGEIVRHAELILIDLVNRSVIDRSPFEVENPPLEVSLRRAEDGSIYGCRLAGIYRIVPGTAQRRDVYSFSIEEAENHIHAPGALVGNRYYFGSNHRLRAVDIRNS